MHKDSVMGRRSFAVSLASDGPIPLDSQPGSVLGEKHLIYRDPQISEILEIVKDRALHVLLDHVTSGRKQLSVRQPIVGSDGKIALFPRLDLTVHERVYLRAVVLGGFLCPAQSLSPPVKS